MTEEEKPAIPTLKGNLSDILHRYGEENLPPEFWCLDGTALFFVSVGKREEKSAS